MSVEAVLRDKEGGVYSLPVVDVSISLRALCAEIDSVTAKQEVVLGRHSHGISHEDRTVADQSHCHVPRDAKGLVVSRFSLNIVAPLTAQDPSACP